MNYDAVRGGYGMRYYFNAGNVEFKMNTVYSGIIIFLLRSSNLRFSYIDHLGTIVVI